VVHSRDIKGVDVAYEINLPHRILKIFNGIFY